jgi:hypothetical protein
MLCFPIDASAVLYRGVTYPVGPLKEDKSRQMRPDLVGRRLCAALTGRCTHSAVDGATIRPLKALWNEAHESDEHPAAAWYSVKLAMRGANCSCDLLTKWMVAIADMKDYRRSLPPSLPPSLSLSPSLSH